jgi:hypothetical protein
MKDVAGDENEIRMKRDDLVDGALKGARYVRLTLIDPSRSEALILSEAEVDVREMDDTHALPPI